MLPKILFFFLFIVMLANQSLVSAARLKCEYDSLDFTSIGSVYYCGVSDNGIFNNERVIIDSVEGEHKEGYTHDSVNGLFLSSISSVKYMPRNIQNVFGNLIALLISSTNLQEIYQNDLKVFPKLQYLNLNTNKIATIDKNLFQFNLSLKVILLYSNRISHIDLHVFDNLNHLESLFLSENNCKNALNDADTRSKVLEMIQRIKSGDCSRIDANKECSTKYNESQSKIKELQNKLDEIKEKYENLLLSNLELSESLNAMLRESNDKINEWKEKYINLLNAKLIENSGTVQ